MTDPLDQTAREISEILQSGALGYREYMAAVLDRIEAINPSINAIVALRDRDELLAEAEAAQKMAPKGWLHGMPLAVKDLTATKGITTTWGSPNFANFVPDADDILAARLQAAGAILIGKTNVPEFGLGSHSTNPVYGVTRNPYDTSRTAGGSSGGAGAALATRLLPVADGSDMMGSLRNPAAWNNVYGFRPSIGVVPSEPKGEVYTNTLSTNGPMARNPGDLAALLEVLAGPDPRVPFTRPLGPPAEAGAQGKRIAWLGDWGGAWPMEPGLLDLCEGALRVFVDLGAVSELVAPPFPAEKIWQSWRDLRHLAVATGQGALYDNPATRDRLKPALVWEIEGGLALSNAQIRAASAIRSDWFRRAARLFEQYDAIALPPTQVWPFPADWDWPKDIAGQSMDTYHRWMECVIPVSLLGLPAIALPAGFGSGGLPGGLQLAGPMGADRTLLAMAEAYHAATDWPGKRPPPL